MPHSSPPLGCVLAAVIILPVDLYSDRRPVRTVASPSLSGNASYCSSNRRPICARESLNCRATSAAGMLWFPAFPSLGVTMQSDIAQGVEEGIKPLLRLVAGWALPMPGWPLTLCKALSEMSSLSIDNYVVGPGLVQSPHVRSGRQTRCWSSPPLPNACADDRYRECSAR